MLKTSLKTSRFAQENRAEQLIAVCRLVLASLGLLAIWRDPTEPARFAEQTYFLLNAYVAYAAILILVLRNLHGPAPRLAFATHVVDLTLYSVLLYLTEGPNSPFFAYFTFAIVAATLRWRTRGAAVTGATAIAIFVGIGLYGSDVMKDPNFELNRFVIRAVYLAVVAVMLGFVGAYEQRERRRSTALASVASAAEERIRLARDLHDGLLQALAAAGLQLASVRPMVAADPAAAQERLERIQRFLTEEQRDLRFFLRELNPDSPEPGDSEARLSARLIGFCERFETFWGIPVVVHIDSQIEIPSAMESEIYRLVQEALVNAGRHAKATRIELSAAQRNRSIQIEISNNGRGFPFSGKLDLAELDSRRLGPVSLKARVRSLGGDLSIDSGPSGARIEIRVPVGGKS